MSQHDMSIANQGFPAFRSDLNDALQALVSQNSGATAPSTTFANMIWYDTANNILKMRNEDNDAWISIFTLNQTTDAITAVGSVTLADLLDTADIGTSVQAYDANLTSFVSTFTLPTSDGTANQALVTDGSGTIGFASVTANNVGFRNRIINGDMRIDQRNSGASVALTGAPYLLDRWQTQVAAASKLTAQQSSVAPNGFVNSLLYTVVGTASLGSTDTYRLIQKIEGFNTADLNWGTANAASITLSFWVRSSVTGSYGASIQNSDGNRSYPFSYTINSANTWEQKSVTIAGDTTGTWGTTSGIGIYLMFGLGVGSSLSGTANVWASADYRSVTGATSLVANSGATWYITGVQLEKGSTATSFDYRPYGTELQLCQRYCHVWSSGGQSYTWVGMGFTFSGGATAHYRFPVIMRASPTATFSEQNKWIADYFNGNSAITGMSVSYVSPEQSRLNATCSPPTNYPFALANNGDAGTRTITFSAEL